jgi:MFS transporter, ACS family, solute carrier family 17 (sodium-dependent inorganic phosphate cotransporter), other
MDTAFRYDTNCKSQSVDHYIIFSTERSQSLSITFAGSNIGVLVVIIFSGLIIHFINWEAVFFIFGGIGCIWYIFWLLIARKSPEYDRFISDEEKRFILTKLELEERERGTKPIPWKQIFLSLPVWAVVVAHFAQNWGAYTLLTQTPLFFVRKHQHLTHLLLEIQLIFEHNL